jgi:hypothetical protein
MLPVIAAAPVVISVVSAIGASAVNSWKGLDPKTKKLTVYALGGTALFVGGRAAYKAIRKAKLLKQVDNPLVQQALAFQQGLDPYDMFGWGTDEKLLINTATEVKDWPGVIQTYKDITGGNLLIDLKGDLSTSDYAKLIDAINASKDAQKGIVKNEGGQALETGGGSVEFGYQDAPNFKDKIFVSNNEFLAWPAPDYGTVSMRINAHSATLGPSGKTMGFGTGRIYKGKWNDGAPYIMLELYFTSAKTNKRYQFWVSYTKMKQIPATNYQQYPLIDTSYVSKEW